MIYWSSFLSALALLFSGSPEVWSIIWLSLQVSGVATLIATAIGLPMGYLLGMSRFAGRWALILLVNTAMGFPPVVIGLFVYMTISRSGPLGALNLLFTPTAMVIAQVIIAAPLVAGVTTAAVAAVSRDVRLQVRALGASRPQSSVAIVKESRIGVMAAVIAGFGGVISEVGAVMLVGGNIEGSTRVMTGAIFFNVQQGDFGLGMAWAIILMGIALAVNAALTVYQNTGAARDSRGGLAWFATRTGQHITPLLVPASTSQSRSADRERSSAMAGDAARSPVPRPGAGSPVKAPAVRAEDVRVSYRGRTVVDVPAIELPAGRTYALLGASGAGKSTLLRVIGLLERPASGRVLFDGTEMRAGDLSARRRTSAVFQKPYLLNGTVGYNVEYGLKLRGIGRASRMADAAWALERVGLAGWEKRSAQTLSGGEAQRVALARALAVRPELLLLDEPLSYMDPLLRWRLTLEFAEILKREQVTALYVTHDQDEAAVVADKIGIMRDGRLVVEGDVDKVLGLPADEWVATFVGMEPAMHGTVVSGAAGMMEIECGGTSVRASGTLSVGDRVSLAVRPEDVAIGPAAGAHSGDDSENRIAVNIVSLRPKGTLVNAVCEAPGVRFVAAVSSASARDLGLATGTAAIAVFKATAVRVGKENVTG